MNTITLLSAWDMWFDGQELSDRVLWGFRILWWGRFGKFAQLLGALAIVSEIIGPARLRDFGKSLHVLKSSQWAINLVRTSGDWALSLLRMSRSNSKEAEENRSKMRASDAHVGGMVLFWSIAIVSTLIWVLVLDGSLLVGMMIGWTVALFVAPLIMVSVTLLVSGGLLAVDALIIKPIAWFLERPALDKAIKIISVLLVLVGSHFELLAA